MYYNNNTNTHTLAVSHLRMINNLLMSVYASVYILVSTTCMTAVANITEPCMSVVAYTVIRVMIHTHTLTHSLSHRLSENYLHGFFFVMVNKWQIEYGDNIRSRRYDAIHFGCKRECYTSH